MLTLTVATPFALVFALYVLPLTVKLTFLPATTVPLADLNVAVNAFVLAAALYDLLGTVNVGVCVSTVIFATTNDALWLSSPKYHIAKVYVPL